MIGALWNIGGLGQHDKLQCLANFLNNNHVVFVGFFESKREFIDDSMLKTISGRTEFNQNYLPAINTAGGIIVGLKCYLFDVIGFSNKKYCILVTVKKNEIGFPGTLWLFMALLTMS